MNIFKRLFLKASGKSNDFKPLPTLWAVTPDKPWKNSEIVLRNYEFPPLSEILKSTNVSDLELYLEAQYFHNSETMSLILPDIAKQITYRISELLSKQAISTPQANNFLNNLPLSKYSEILDVHKQIQTHCGIQEIEGKANVNTPESADRSSTTDISYKTKHLTNQQADIISAHKKFLEDNPGKYMPEI